MLNLRRTLPNHEEIFVGRFDRLTVWARQIAGDPDAADDLVQDAYLRFTTSRPDLERIQDLDAYLYRIVQNLHLSRVRRSGRVSVMPVSVLDFDSAATGWRSLDPAARVAGADDLSRI